ncbi:MAG: S8 family serine peptidase [Gammaproteobacteria bacterium]
MKYKYPAVTFLLAFISFICSADDAKPTHVMVKAPAAKSAIAEQQGLTPIKFMPGLFIGTTTASEALSQELGSTVERVPGSYEELEVSAASMLLKTPDDATSPISNWWKAGFTGTSAIIGILDSGVPDNYATDTQSFIRQSGLRDKNMIVNRGDNSGFDKYLNGVRTPHGTGVACIYGNEQSERPGIAHGVQNMLVTLAGDSTVDDTDWALTLVNLDWLLETPNQIKPTTINYSFGNGDVTENWSTVAQTVDYIVHHYGVTWVKSAGNSGWVAPSDEAPYANTMSIPADSYNAIVVANMNNTLQKTSTSVTKTSDRSQHYIQSTSSRGPTFDGRRKPDITAPGNDTRTCAPDQTVYAVPENPTFSPYAASMQYDAVSETRLAGGTSMATPHVGGASALIYDSGITEPMAIKALLINSADAWTDSDQQDPASHHAVPGSLWNRTYGWGYINMDNAFKQKEFVKREKIHPRRMMCYSGELSPNDKVTLVWERRVSTDNGEILLHDLTPMTLRLYQAKGHVLLDEDVSVIDNVLQVNHTGTDTSRTMLEISIADGAQIDGARYEPFALASGKALRREVCRDVIAQPPTPRG